MSGMNLMLMTSRSDQFTAFYVPTVRYCHLRSMKPPL